MFKWLKPISDVQRDRLLGLLDWSAFLLIAAVFLIGSFYLIFY
jgi:hypothetical protein